MPGYRLRACRNERGYTQQQIADVLGVTRSAYTHYETGRYSISTDQLIALADFYGCTTDEIVGSRAYYDYIAKQQQ